MLIFFLMKGLNFDEKVIKKVWINVIAPGKFSEINHLIFSVAADAPFP